MNREEVSILVVDDVNTMRVQIRELLKSFGFRKVTICPSGQDAKKFLETDLFHLVLCDWHMAPGDGVDLLQFIRTHPVISDTAFVMVTAENTRDKVMEAIRSGVDDYLVKPLTPAQIQSKVYGVLIKKKVLSS
jgi:two-component system chemotaxis response regulator CheY